MIDSHEIQHSILEMQAKRSRLGIRKQELQANINKTKEMLRYVAQGCETFDELVIKKKGYVADLNDVNAEIMQLKTDIKKRQLLKEEVKATEEPKSIALEADLVVLRDRYLEFASDKSRITSMRTMAATIAQDLTKVLKKL